MLFELGTKVSRKVHAKETADGRTWRATEKVRKPRVSGKACPGFGKSLKEKETEIDTMKKTLSFSQILGQASPSRMARAP